MNVWFFVLVGVLFSTPLYAQSDDAVIIATFGGVQELPVRDLAVAGQTFSVTSLGKRRIVPVGEDVRIGDIKILPDGSHLLADANGRGVALTSPDGSEYRYVLDPFFRMTSVRSVSVATYFSPGQPSIVALADSGSQFASLREISTNNVVWFESFRNDAANADIVSVIVMPNNQVGVAVNWTGIGLSAIDIFNIDEVSPPTRYANIASMENPPNTVVVPALDTIRELMLLEDDSFLVTTRFTILNVDRSLGTVNWSIGIGDDPALGGEFSSARMLPSGRVAVTTYQPGEWTRPHINHRAHWIDIDTETVVATSDVFLAAPLRVEPLGGHGGTGSFGFTSGLSEIGDGDPDDVSLVTLGFSSDEVAIGDRLPLAATVQNGGQFLVGLATLLVEARPGTCEELRPVAQEFARAIAVSISPGASYSLTAEPLITSNFGLGEWCATVRFEDITGVWRDLGEGTPFTIVRQKTETDSTVVIRDLPFDSNPDRDMGAVDGGGDIGPSGGGGGCCRTTPSRLSPSFPMLLCLLGLIGVTRSISRKPTVQ